MLISKNFFFFLFARTNASPEACASCIFIFIVEKTMKESNNMGK